MNKQPTYILVGFLLALSVYLKSPIVGIFSVVLIAVEYGKDILIKNNVVKEVEDLKEVILALQSQANLERVRMEQIEKEMTNMRMRIAETIGEGI